MKPIRNLIKLFILTFLIISGENDLYSQNCFQCPGNTANGNKSTAGGTGSTASGAQSFAYGNAASATGTTSFSFGTNTYTSPTAINSFAFGRNSTAEDAFSFSLGYFSNAMGFRSYALGNFAQTLAGDCFAIGSYVHSLGSGSITLGCSSSGRELINPYTNSLMVGFSDVPSMLVNENSFMTGFVHDQPFFYVGPKSSIDHTINVGIGTTTPEQPLHVNGNSLVDGHIYLIGEYSNLVFSDELCSGTRGDFAIEYHEGGLNFWKPWKQGGIYTGNYYLFLKDDGKVGINTNAPKTQLDVNGDMSVRGLATGAGLKMVVVNDRGVFSSEDIVGGDNLGNHIATQNLNLNGYFLSGDNEDEGIYIDPDGNIGVNTTQPIAPFDMVSQSDNSLMVRTTTAKNSSLWAINSINGYGIGVEPDGTGYIYSSYPTNNKLIYFKDDKVGIGAPPKGTHNLYVAGGITTEEVKVRIQSNWTDYVFNESYPLQPITELENFIKENKHLPGVPSSEEVDKNGIELGEMNSILLKKIEELTLYMISQDKKINEMQVIIEKLQQKD